MQCTSCMGYIITPGYRSTRTDYEVVVLILYYICVKGYTVYNIH